MINYDLIMPINGTKYYFQRLITGLTLEDSIDEIAYRAEVSLQVTPDFPSFVEGQLATVAGIPYGQTGIADLLSNGIVWTRDKNTAATKKLNLTIYDRTIYLKSEDEYLFPAGQTASQRLKQYAKDWNIPLGQVADTKIALAAATYRAQPIYAMIMADLKETARKGGALFRAKFSGAGLDLSELGTNQIVWRFLGAEEINESSSLDNTVTQVKVLGNAVEGTKSEVLAIVKGSINQYGTIQRVLSDEKITTSGQARTEGQKVLRDPMSVYQFSTIDVNTIRGGDKINLNEQDYIVCSVTHNCGAPGRMSIRAAASDYVRHEYYFD